MFPIQLPFPYGLFGAFRSHVRANDFLKRCVGRRFSFSTPGVWQPLQYPPGKEDSSGYRGTVPRPLGRSWVQQEGDWERRNRLKVYEGLYAIVRALAPPVPSPLQVGWVEIFRDSPLCSIALREQLSLFISNYFLKNAPFED